MTAAVVEVVGVKVVVSTVFGSVGDEERLLLGTCGATGVDIRLRLICVLRLSTELVVASRFIVDGGLGKFIIVSPLTVDSKLIVGSKLMSGGRLSSREKLNVGDAKRLLETTEV